MLAHEYFNFLLGSRACLRPQDFVEARVNNDYECEANYASTNPKSMGYFVFSRDAMCLLFIAWYDGERNWTTAGTIYSNH